MNTKGTGLKKPKVYVKSTEWHVQIKGREYRKRQVETASSTTYEYCVREGGFGWAYVSKDKVVSAIDKVVYEHETLPKD